MYRARSQDSPRDIILISSAYPRTTVRLRTTVYKSLTSELNLSSICYSKLLYNIYIGSKTVRQTPPHFRNKTMKKHPRGEGKGGIESYSRIVYKYLQNNPVCETKSYYRLFVRLFEKVLRVLRRRTNDSNPAEITQEVLHE
jgi:hypothetical protein